MNCLDWPATLAGALLLSLILAPVVSRAESTAAIAAASKELVRWI